MKIVVIGGSGLIGSKVVAMLGAQGHEAVAASPKTGVNTLTGEGLANVLDGADVVVDVSNSPSYEDAAVLEFFQTSTRNLLSAEAEAGVGHHVALSVVGSDRMPDSGYLRAKLAQEKLIADSKIPYSLVRATQFFEFAQGIVDAATDGDTVRLAPVLIQPVAADDVAATVAGVAVDAPTNGVVEVAGPERFRLDELGRSTLAARHDPREVVTDPASRYFGALLGERSLVPADGARIAGTRLEDWRTQATHKK
ncbi:MAG: SDR family oxidoreductase [Micromonospora sp.]